MEIDGNYTIWSRISGNPRTSRRETPEVVKRLSGYLAAYKEDLAKNKRPAGGPQKQPRKKKNK